MSNLIEGVIVEIDGETAKVRTSVHSDCENCGVCPGSNAMIIDAIDPVGVKPGDSVLIESKQSNMLLAAFMIYIFPLLSVGCGILFGYWVSAQWMVPQALSMTLGGLILGVGSIAAVKGLDQSLQSDKPVIRSIK
ncbi:MAG: SoxR reducing system RseC family protein [Solirubrobacterales bacterium]